MKTFRISTLAAIALVTGMCACNSLAAPHSARANKGDAALVDEDGKATESKAESTAESPAKESSDAQPAQANPACDSTATDSGSKVPVFPIVMSAIGTVAFIILAIIF